MSITITSTTTTLVLNDPQTTSIGIVKNMELINYTDGTNAERDRGKTGHSLTITGLEYNLATNNMEYLNSMMDNKDIITISGFQHLDLNTNYYIQDLNFKRQDGEPTNYYYTMVLERIRDE